jgi:hypothetical protein
MAFLLYYAGMSDDPDHIEQIGLAVAEDGVDFRRVGADGLILPRDSAVPWKNLRTCNPTVVPTADGQLVMFYQGIGNPLGARSPPSEPQVTSLALAVSHDGRRWECRSEPMLSWRDMRAIDPAQDLAVTIGLIEPSALLIDGVWHLWFVYLHKTMPGNALFHATSRDLSRWQIAPSPVLTGAAFGACDFHYPQVLQRAAGFELWFTLRDSGTGVFGIFRLSSGDGLTWRNLQQVLPRPAAAIPDLRPQHRALPVARLGGDDGHLASLAKRAWNRLARQATSLLHPGQALLRACYGYAHPHVLESGGTTHLYFHYCNLERGKLTLDIGRARLDEGGALGELGLVFPKAAKPGAWDGYFTADPFVLVLNEAPPAG